MNKKVGSIGVMYVAFGESYVREAKKSIASLRKVSSTIPISVVTDKEWYDEYVPDKFLIRDPIFSFECKPIYIPESPYDRTLFLDTDTYVARDITPVFNLLDYYDIGVLFGGNQLNDTGIECHLQCSSSTILFKNNIAVKDVFRRWTQIYLEQKEVISNVKDSRGLGDQRYLAIAIAKSKARPLHLGTHLNFILCAESVATCPPYVYTGRNVDNEWANYRLTNKWDTAVDWKERIWMPNIKGVFPRGRRKYDPILLLALGVRRLVNSLYEKFWRLRRYFFERRSKH